MTRRQSSDPAEYRPRRNNRGISIARYPGSCDWCGKPWVVNQTKIQRVKGNELCLDCAGKE
jgi:hypothetical protein